MEKEIHILYSIIQCQNLKLAPVVKASMLRCAIVLSIGGKEARGGVFSEPHVYKLPLEGAVHHKNRLKATQKTTQGLYIFIQFILHFYNTFYSAPSAHKPATMGQFYKETATFL